MTDNQPKDPTQALQRTGYTPASPLKRGMAWIALFYVLVFLALTTFYYFTGQMLTNLTALLAIPGLVGLGTLIIISYKTTGTPTKSAAIVLALVCFALALCSIPTGLAGLMSNFGG